MFSIPARNEITNAKARGAPSYQRASFAHYVESRALAYRNGALTAEDLTPLTRQAVMVWLLEHPRAASQRTIYATRKNSIRKAS